jgi:hypothetical protein
MAPNWMAILVASLVPLVIGAVWYNPKVLGTAWMKSAGLTEKDLEGANMLMIFGLTFVFSFFAAMSLNFVVIHQASFYAILVNEPGFGDPNSDIGKYIAEFMTNYGDNFRTFKHGALHGGITGVFLALPVLGTNALFERKGFRYILLNSLYWVISFMIMGGIICAWQ